VTRRIIGRLLPFLIALGIVLLLLGQINPAEIVQLLFSADRGWLLIGFGCYVLTNILRAGRFGVLLSLPDRPIPLRILPEMFALSLLNNSLPSRSGELSFPYFMRRRHGISAGESTAALIVARIFDYLAVALLYVGFALLNLNKLAPGASRVVLVVAAMLLVSLVILAATPWLGQKGLAILNWLLLRLGMTNQPVGKLIARGASRTVETFEHMRTPRIYAQTLGWSGLTWLGTFAWFGAFMQSIHLPQPFALVIVGATFAMLAKAIPFITVGGFGAHEAGWVVGFSLVGMATDTAIASGFAVNILTLLASILFGGASLAWMRFSRGRELPVPAESSSPDKVDLP
jgi:glycosyltransferase 2 family protein